MNGNSYAHRLYIVPFDKQVDAFGRQTDALGYFIAEDLLTDKVFHVDGFGRPLYPEQYSLVLPFSKEGLAVVAMEVYDETSGKYRGEFYRLIRADGSFACNDLFDLIGDFGADEEGVALAILKGRRVRVLIQGSHCIVEASEL